MVKINYIKEFELLPNDGVYGLAKIEWWLLKYENEYHSIKSIEDSKNTLLFNGEGVVLPSLKNIPSEEDKFICLYDALETLSKLHRNENYFKQEMAIYKEIKNNPKLVHKWLAKNEELGSDIYVCFLVDYLDYDINNNEWHLSVFLLEDIGYDVMVNREDFENTIEFKETFDDIYWQLLEKLDVDKLN